MAVLATGVHRHIQQHAGQHIVLVTQAQTATPADQVGTVFALRQPATHFTGCPPWRKYPHRCTARTRVLEGIGMHRHEQIRIALARLAGTPTQTDIIVTGTGKHGAVSLFRINQTLELLGNLEHHILFTHAIGPGGVREKDVVLKIAQELKRLIDAEKGYRAVLTRTGDYYVSLRGRTGKARQSNADLFVSVHADAFKDPRARGASVWVLSPRGATSEMGRWLAQRENSADLIGGVGSLSLGDKDDVLASVLLDMSMNASRKDSHQVASRIHGNMASFARMHKKHVEQAGFVVLKSPDIPSILVETGFISNPEEARLLKTDSYRKRMAQAIFRGITGHFWEKPPTGTYVAWAKQSGTQLAGGGERLYKVVSGDTLSIIAQRNGVSLQRLRQANQRSEEHTSELQSRPHLVCRLLLEKKKNADVCQYT